VAPGIEIVAANLEYGHQLLFQNLNLTLASAQWTCLLGPSGVGKTSLLRLIAGLNTTATSDSIITTDGIALTGRVAYMAQQESLLPWLSVSDNVTLGDSLRGKRLTPLDRERAHQLLSDVGLQQVSHCLPSALSGGMKQRVVLARTLYEDKPIILMDEPFAAVDIITRALIQELAAKLLRNRTVLLVTHDPLEALRLGHHVYIMSGKPARITSQIELPGLPPRELTDSLMLQTHAEILAQLSHANEAYT
jgi:putative hydroxymethylpyrimidine transport system ATP-binding protein